MKRRILSITTALALCLSLCPTWAFAAEADPALCPHHREHTRECGYAAPAEGHDCGHQHTAECYTLGVLPGVDGGDPYEIGADTENLLDCQHSHDSECGYVQADPGQPCGYVCPLCPIEDLIAALPGDVTEDNADEVRGRLDEILALFSELTEDEQEQIELSLVYALQGALDGANDPDPVEGEVSVDYQEATWDGSTVTYTPHTGQSCTPVADTTAEWNAEWYAVSGTVTIDQPITVSGNVHLILADGCTLNAEQGIVVTKNNSLTIYAQSGGTGTLNATGTTDSANNASAGIGGGTSSLDSGRITIHGGVIHATGGKAGYYGGAGIGGSTSASENGGNSGTITIYGGTVTANSGTGNVTGAGIGGGSSNSSTDVAVGGDGSGIIIYGGDVTATSHATAAGGAGIGGGSAAKNGGAGSNIQIFGGRVTATGGKCAAGIGGGSGSAAGSGGAPTKSGDGAVTISGGIVTAVGSGYAAGIGGGGGYEYTLPWGSPPTTYTLTGGTGNVTISGGIVDASSPTDVRYADYKGAPIGNGGNTTTEATVSKTNAIVFENGVGTVCGSVTLTEPYTVPDGYSLSFEDGAAVTGEISVPSAAARVEKGGRITGFLDENGLDAAFAENSGNSGAIFTLLKDVTRTKILDIQIDCTLNLGGRKISNNGLVYINILENVNVTITGEGKVISGVPYTLYVMGNVTLEGGTFTGESEFCYGSVVGGTNGTLSVTGENVVIQHDNKAGLDVNNAQSVRLSAGTYSSISVVGSSHTLASLLVENCAYYKGSTPILLSELEGQKELTGPVTVQRCEHDKSVCAYTPNEGTDTHAMTCLACGYAGAAEDCQYTYTPDSDGTHHTAACQFCGRAKTEMHTYGSWTPEHNENTVTIRRSCESCGYTKTDGTFTAPARNQTMQYGKPITLTCSSTLPGATFSWSIEGSTTEGRGASFTLPETLTAGEYDWRVTVDWSGSGGVTCPKQGWVQVTPAPLPDVTLSPASAVYNGTAQKPAVAIAGLTAGTDYTVAYTGDFTNAGTHTVTVTGQGNYEGTVTKTFTIEKAALTADGTGTASGTYGAKLSDLTVTDLTAKLGEAPVTGTWKLTGDAIPNAGDTETHAAAFTPAGGGENYKPLTAQVTLNIAKATALPTKTGDLAVANGRAHTYAYGLGALRPDVPEGMSLGSAAVTYELGTVSLGSYYDSAKDGAKIEGQTLTLPIEAVESNSETGIGTITVTIHTGNYEDMTATINVRSVNKTVPTGEPTLSTDTLNYGQTLSAITLSGSMQDNGTSVPGTFAWSSPDNRPAVQEKYAAAWTFTPTDNGKYAIVTGTALIRVLPAPIAGAVIVLEPSAFRYQEGKTQKPSITSVTLNGTELTADVDYTAAIPEGTAAGTYTVTLRGMGNYTGEATATFTINPVEQKPLDQKDDDGHELRLEVETGLSTVPDALENISEYDTPAKIESALRTRVADVLSNVGEQIAVFDVTLQYKDSNGTWHNVDPDNFPADGVTAVLPYPAGTGATGYTFTVQHLISSGPQAGTMETLAYELTTDGLRCKFSSLSPVAIGYQAVTTPNPQPNPGGSSGGNHGGGGGGSVSTYAVTVEKSEHGKVTSNRTNASSGSTVTLTVAPDSGYVLDTLTVTDSRGNEIKLMAQGGNKYTFTMPSRAVTVKASFVLLPDDTQKPCDGGENCPSRGFTDLGGVGTWYHEAVDYVLRNGLMGGYGNGTFGPNNNLTRAQFAQILFNKEGKPVVNYLLQYSDVAEGAWYTEAVRWATSQNIVGGYGNGTFGPNDNITREQLAVMLWRYAGSPAATDKELHFTDKDKISGYALEALRWAVENGIISGYGNGQLGPKGLATRAQVAQMLKNFLDK